MEGRVLWLRTPKQQPLKLPFRAELRFSDGAPVMPTTCPVPLGANHL
jgi:hypothetical protein